MKEKIDMLLLEKRRYGLEQKVSFVEKFKLKKDVPIQKIIGYIEMADVKIDISKKVLIPRYETEELIYLVLDLIKKNNYKNILDLGCGSGFIGIAIAKNNCDIFVTMSDVDKRAIKQTKQNIKLNNVDNINVIYSNLFENINSKYDIIVSNPPYLLEEQKKEMNNSVLKYEPYSALFAKVEGLYFYKQIDKNLNKYLNEDGMIFFEINPLLVEWFLENNYTIVKDINGKNRFAYKKIN